MKPFVSVLFLVIIVLGSRQTSLSQKAPVQPPAALEPVRVVGQAEVYYLARFNRTTAEIQFGIFGEIADIYRKKDVVVLMVEYDTEGTRALKPGLLKFRVTIYYGADSKFRNDHKLSIYLDNKQMLSGELIPRSDLQGASKITTTGYLELPEFRYKHLLKMTKATKITFTIGENKIELKPDHIQAFSDLNNTIEK